MRPQPAQPKTKLFSFIPQRWAPEYKGGACIVYNWPGYKDGGQMLKMTDVEVEQFLKDEAAAKERFRKNFARAKEIEARRDMENTALRKAGL